MKNTSNVVGSEFSLFIVSANEYSMRMNFCLNIGDKFAIAHQFEGAYEIGLRIDRELNAKKHRRD